MPNSETISDVISGIPNKVSWDGESEKRSGPAHEQRAGSLDSSLRRLKLLRNLRKNARVFLNILRSGAGVGGRRRALFSSSNNCWEQWQRVHENKHPKQFPSRLFLDIFKTVFEHKMGIPNLIHTEKYVCFDYYTQCTNVFNIT